MRVALGTFARECVEARLGSNVRIGVLMALLHYTRRLKSGKKPIAPPRFYRDRPRGDGGDVLDLQIGPEAHAALESHAREHSLPLNEVVVHAVFVYLADLEAYIDLAPSRLHRFARDAK